MRATLESPPEHVCSAFGGRTGDAEPLPGTTAWRYNDLVLKPVVDKSRTLWTARALEAVDEPGLRVAKPVRSSDGRWIVGGWSANRYVSGTAEHRYDEVVHAAVKLHRATAGLPRPDFLGRRTDIEALADKLAWGEAEMPLDENKGGRWFEVLAGSRRPVKLPDQVVHGELLAGVLFDGDAAPGIVDFVPYYRPGEWGAAIVAVDALAWGGATIDLLERWAHLPQWPQLLLRAVLFRLAANALDPRSTRAAHDGLRAAARDVSAVL
ncbi:TIGR02569 family protein [Amycolatopsis lurida]|uniref:Aminoglycoside phosphotransferase n=1 Tax=Amycolatopsis lurida NRRL 2430 TaxID=1460371 RepID=A0A2P2FS17_AMYLU|nr:MULTISPECIES: TIGR02569 family protein [Amycolatopsis]KFU79525.1 aminoglycoside phosphotransferase [Amycolatopsis lurida NRRL 2430]QXV59663.1 TIGR02569 family protein [Amycolatopsis sp. TNS106]SED22008.1 TIGR02569 family protein [Amycolatopsis lurida]